MSKIIRLSIHQLVDFLLRSGDIDNRVFSSTTMQEGSRLHSIYQSKQGDNYLSEYFLKTEIEVDKVLFVLEGRADGIIKKPSQYIIDEIKTTILPLEQFKEQNYEWHLGQAICYGYMFSKEQNLNSIGIRITYIRQGKEKEKLFINEYFLFDELKKYVISLLKKYLAFYNVIFEHLKQRRDSIKKLGFPFPNYRQGQKQLAKYAYSVAKNGGIFFCEAPTGIGKTISTLFPYIKALQDDENGRVFYLTAKSSGKETAYNTIERLKDNGLVVNNIIITAKEKICFCKEKECNPDSCPYTKGYFNKIQDALRTALSTNSTFDYDTICELAQDFEICPFEFQLDISLFCDIIVCDYNYAFDPLSYMKRYFDEDCSHFLLLVDEAHNLVERSKDMYSAYFSLTSLNEAKKSIKGKKILKISTRLNKLLNIMNNLNEQYPLGYTLVEDYPYELIKELIMFQETYTDISKTKDKDISYPKPLKDFFLDVNSFIKLSEFCNDKFIKFFDKSNNNLIVHFSCLDASDFLKTSFSRVKSSTIFSATLSPIDYYIDILGGDTTSNPQLVLPSPFNRDNLYLMVATEISIKYKNRDATLKEVKEYIYHFVKNKVGNYFIYTPSYSYLEKLIELIDFDDVDVFVQEKDMSEKNKQLFLRNFNPSPNKTTLGFLVIGGAFSEGIDLIDDRLIGAVIIGVGLPRINFISDKTVEYYNAKDKPGFEYAYINPGMNKVMQAVGRVIRSESDKGAVLLIDERYARRDYKALFKREWENYHIVKKASDVSLSLEKFFKK